MSTRPAHVIALLSALVLGVSACADVEDAADDVTTDDSAESEPEGEAADEGATTDDGAADEEGTGEEDGVAGSGLDGTHTLSTEAGEVDVAIDGGALTLDEVRPEGAWEHSVDDESSEEIEIDFRGEDGRRAELAMEDDDGDLDVEFQYEDGTPEDTQPFDLGEIVSIDHEVADGSVQTVEVTAGDGWEANVAESDDDIEAMLRHENGQEVDIALEADD